MIASLHPESDPPSDKGSILSQRFLDFRKELGLTEMPLGILLQSTIGHGWYPSSPAKFPKFEFPNTDELPYIFCPLDEGLRHYIEDAVSKLAETHPDFFMVDDDFRMLTGRGACFCPLHIARFNREQNANYTKKTLLQAIKNDPAVAKAYDELQKQSLVELAAIIRRAIDKVDPAIPCQFCICSYDQRHGTDIAKTLAAKDQPLTIRINNGTYFEEASRYIPSWLVRSARQIQYFNGSGISLLAEPDTCPYNNYSTSAAVLHTNMTCSLLEGCAGGKLWITRDCHNELDSGKRYRKQLKKYCEFYKVVAGLQVDWSGVIVPFPRKDYLNLPLSEKYESNNNWCSQILGKMGFPFYFSTFERMPENGIAALALEECLRIPDEELLEILKNQNVILDGSAAIELCKRGFSDLIGVMATEYSGIPTVTQEETVFPENGIIYYKNTCAKLEELEGAEILSRSYHTDSETEQENKKQYIMPGSVLYVNRYGRKVVTLSACIRYGVNFDVFHILNETRRKMLVHIFELLGGLNWYVPGDDEIILKNGTLDAENELIFALDISQDDIEVLSLVSSAGKAASVDQVQMLQPDGSWQEVSFEVRNNTLNIQADLRSLRPQFFRLHHQN